MRKLITAVATAVMVTLSMGSSYASDPSRLVAAEAKKQGVPVSLAVAVARVESTFNCRAYSSGNYGLMQIRYKTAKGLGYKGSAKGLYDCATNAHYGVMYLKAALRMAGGNHCHAATLYNRGIYAKPRSSGYCKKVLKAMR